MCLTRSIKTKTRKKGVTYDCAFLEPLALPPDFPPVILNVGCKRVGFEKSELGVVELRRADGGWQRVVVRGKRRGGKATQEVWETL